MLPRNRAGHPPRPSQRLNFYWSPTEKDTPISFLPLNQHLFLRIYPFILTP